MYFLCQSVNDRRRQSDCLWINLSLADFNKFSHRLSHQKLIFPCSSHTNIYCLHCIRVDFPFLAAIHNLCLRACIWIRSNLRMPFPSAFLPYIIVPCPVCSFRFHFNFFSARLHPAASIWLFEIFVRVSLISLPVASASASIALTSFCWAHSPFVPQSSSIVYLLLLLHSHFIVFCLLQPACIITVPVSLSPSSNPPFLRALFSLSHKF